MTSKSTPLSHSTEPDHDPMSETAREQAPPDSDFERLARERDEYLKGWKRALADYENFKKDASQRTAQLQIHSTTEFFRELLPLFDTLHQTLHHIPANHSASGWYQGLRALQAQWKQFMIAHGVQMIHSVKMKFNPEFHEAIGTDTKEGFEDGQILTVVSEGYILNNQIVIRPAKVIVNKLT